MRRVVYWIVGITVWFAVCGATGYFSALYFHPVPEIYFTPGMSCEDGIISHIETSDAIDIAVYAITNDNIVDALIDAHDRGAKIRIITDYLQSCGPYSAIDKLRDIGIPVRTNKSIKKHKIMHNKFAIFNNLSVVTGSYNWTRGATGYNVENCIFFENLAQRYIREFTRLWDMYGK